MTAPNQAQVRVWEDVGYKLQRAVVPGGYLYRTWNGPQGAPAMTFVPDGSKGTQDQYDYGNMHRLCDLLAELVEMKRGY